MLYLEEEADGDDGGSSHDLLEDWVIEPDEMVEGRDVSDLVSALWDAVVSMTEGCE